MTPLRAGTAKPRRGTRDGGFVTAVAAAMVLGAPAATSAAEPHAQSAAATPETHCPGATGANLARYEAYSTAVLNGHQLARLGDYVSARFHWHDAPPGTPDGIEPVRRLLQDLRRAFPDRKVETRFALCVDDLVLVQQTLTGTNTGPLLGFPPTGRAHRALHTEIYRIVDGLISEQWGEGVIPVVLQQSGWTLVWPGDGRPAAPGSGAPPRPSGATP